MTDLTIEETSRAAGVTADTLRQWEARYRWPTPYREGKGHARRYTPQLAEEIKRVVAYLKRSGKSIGQIMCHERPVLGVELVERERPPTLDFSDIPLPKTQMALSLRAALEAALHARNLGKVAECHASLPLVHPAERDLAYALVVERAKAAVQLKVIVV